MQNGRRFFHAAIQFLVATVSRREIAFLPPSMRLICRPTLLDSPKSCRVSDGGSVVISTGGFFA